MHKDWQEGWTRARARVPSTLSKQHSSSNSHGVRWPDNCRGWESWAEKRINSLHPSRTWRKGKFRLSRFSQNPLSHPHNFSVHYEEGAHWRTKKLRNLKATSPYLCWTVCSSLTNMASATSASAPTLLSPLWILLHLFLTLFVSKYKRQPRNHPAVLSLCSDQFLQK